MYSDIGYFWTVTMGSTDKSFLSCGCTGKVHISHRVGAQPGDSKAKMGDTRAARGGGLHRWDRALPCDSTEAHRGELACSGLLLDLPHDHAAGDLWPSKASGLVPSLPALGDSHKFCSASVNRYCIKEEYFLGARKKPWTLGSDDLPITELSSYETPKFIHFHVDTASPQGFLWICSVTKHVWNYQDAMEWANL